VEERLSLTERNHLYERLSPEQRDELLQGLLIAAPNGGEAVIKVHEDTLLCHATEELIAGALEGGEADRQWGGRDTPSGDPFWAGGIAARNQYGFWGL